MGRAITVAIDGPDKVGKETQTKLLAKALTERGLRAQCFEIPTDRCASFDLIYEWLENGEAVRHPNEFWTLQAINRLNFQRYLLHHMTSVDVWILDRWHASHWAYPAAAGLDEELFDTQLMRGVFVPDLTLIFLGGGFDTKERPYEDGDVYEKDTVFQSRVLANFQKWSWDSSLRTRLHPQQPPGFGRMLGIVGAINADQPIEQVHRSVLQHVLLTRESVESVESTQSRPANSD